MEILRTPEQAKAEKEEQLQAYVKSILKKKHEIDLFAQVAVCPYCSNTFWSAGGGLRRHFHVIKDFTTGMLHYKNECDNCGAIWVSDSFDGKDLDRNISMEQMSMVGYTFYQGAGKETAVYKDRKCISKLTKDDVYSSRIIGNPVD